MISVSSVSSVLTVCQAMLNTEVTETQSTEIAEKIQTHRAITEMLDVAELPAASNARA